MPPEIDTVHAALERNDLDAARAALVPLVAAAPAVRDPAHHLALGRAAEDAGEWLAAETAYNLLLRDDPANPVALGRLAALAAEAGDHERAAVHRERLADERPEDTRNLLELLETYRLLGWTQQARRTAERLSAAGVRLEPPPWADPGEAAEDEDDASVARGDERPQPDLAAVVDPTDADLARFLALFAGREDVHARQWYSPRKGIAGYSPVEAPLTVRHLRQHLFGDVTLGVYPIRLDGTCLFFALDVDLTRQALEWARRGAEEAARVKDDLDRAVVRAVAACRELGLEPVVEDSGYKGRHLWFFLARPERAELLYGVVRAIRQRFEPDLPGGVAVEAFPKQPRRGGKGYGNLIKLPLGVHRRTGRRAWLLDGDGAPHPHPFRLLSEAPRIGHAGLLGLVDRLAADGEVEGVVAPASAEAPPPDPAPRAAPPEPPRWTEADFARHPTMAHLLGRCEVVAELVRRALESRHLEHDEVVVLQHVLGHMPGGVAAVNYLLGRCPGISEAQLLKSPLRGNPISCPKIRKRIPGVTSRLDCACRFDAADDHYPTPVLHLRDAPPAPPEAAREDVPDPQDVARRYLALEERLDALRAELGRLAAVAAAAARRCGGRIALEEGELALVADDGVETLRWQPAEAAAPAGDRAPSQGTS